MIGVAIAFLAPWIIALVGGIWIVKRIARARPQINEICRRHACRYNTLGADAHDSIMSIQPFSLTNRAVQSLPKHLLQFAVDQRYDDYTPVDHRRLAIHYAAERFFSPRIRAQSLFSRDCSTPGFRSTVFRASRK